MNYTYKYTIILAELKIDSQWLPKIYLAIAATIVKERRVKRAAVLKLLFLA
jgi:hypothetical protein